MLQQKGKKASKLTAMLLSLMMVVVFVPTFAYAAAADDITVFMTISDQGDLAEANDGSAMAWKEVTVKDLNEDGHFTYNEALVAVHEQYNSPDGYATTQSGSGVTKLWGETTKRELDFWFANNGKSLRNGVKTDEIKANDYLMAAIFCDQDFTSDYISSFDAYEKKVKVNEPFELTLTGSQAKAFKEDEAVGIADADVGIWKDGELVEMAVADSEGKAQLSFDAPGTYIVTADGTVEDTVEAFNIMFDETYLVDDNGTPIGIDLAADDEEFESGMAVPYTEQDYGTEGPYPAEDIEWADWMDWFGGDVEGYPLYTNKILCDCQTMAPACIVKVYDVMPAEPADVTVTVNNKGTFALAKDGSPMAEVPVTVTDRNEDGHLTIDEALAAAHEEYYETGLAGFESGGTYNSILKLWGNDSGNYLTYINGVGIYDMSNEVAEGDSVYTSIIADSTYYADWTANFTDKAVATITDAKVKLTIVGHLGMGYTPEELTDVPLKGLQVGLWRDGEFVPLDGAVTDENGNVELQIDKPGVYLLTATGTVRSTVTDWNQGGAQVEADCPIMVPYCFVQVEAKTSGGIGDKKAEALSELMASYDLSAYRTAEQIQILTLVVEAQQQIANANSSVEINAILRDAKAAISEMTTDEQYKEEIAAVKAIKVTGVSVKAGKKKATVKWKADETFEGYQISYQLGKKKAKTIKVAGSTTTSKVIKKLKAKKKYSFKVRGYKTIGGEAVYGAWSKAKKAKIK